LLIYPYCTLALWEVTDRWCQSHRFPWLRNSLLCDITAVLRLGVCCYKTMTSQGNFTKDFVRWGIDISFLSLIRNTFDFSVSWSFSTRLAIKVIFFEMLNSDNYRLQAFDVIVDLSYTGWLKKDWTFLRILYSVSNW
jgi:hypothetical protein